MKDSSTEYSSFAIHSENNNNSNTLDYHEYLSNTIRSTNCTYNNNTTLTDTPSNRSSSSTPPLDQTQQQLLYALCFCAVQPWNLIACLSLHCAFAAHAVCWKKYFLSAHTQRTADEREHSCVYYDTEYAEIAVSAELNITGTCPACDARVEYAHLLITRMKMLLKMQAEKKNSVSHSSRSSSFYSTDADDSYSLMKEGSSYNYHSADTFEVSEEYHSEEEERTIHDFSPSEPIQHTYSLVDTPTKSVSSSENSLISSISSAETQIITDDSQPSFSYTRSSVSAHSSSSAASTPLHFHVSPWMVDRVSAAQKTQQRTKKTRSAAEREHTHSSHTCRVCCTLCATED